MVAILARVEGHEGEGDLALRTEKCSRKQCFGDKMRWSRPDIQEWRSWGKKSCG